MFYTIDNKVITVKTVHGPQLQQDKDPALQQPFASDEQAIDWAKTLYEERNYYFYDCNVVTTVKNNTCKFELELPVEDMPEEIEVVIAKEKDGKRSFIEKEEEYLKEEIFYKEDDDYSLRLRNLEPGVYHIDVQPFYKDDKRWATFMNEKNCTFVIE